MPIPGNFLSSVTEMVDPNTSGWTPLLNCTTSLGSGGRNGDGCLTVKSVAAGETRARTVSSYPVQAGTVYQAFADASSPTVAERIGIRWLDAANAELSITWSLSTATVTTTWHRIGVAGAPPMGAVRAQVVLAGMTPAAAGVINYFENVYLGLPIRTTGNLLDFNTETIEVDASGWTAETNATVSRTVPAFSWPVDYYHGGGHMLAMTVTANGNASVKTAPVICTAGEEYVFFGHITPPVTGMKCYYELRFLDASGTQLKVVRTVLDAGVTAGSYRQVGSDIAPAGTVSAVLAAGIAGGTAGQVVRYDNIVVAVLSQTEDNQTIAPRPAGSVIPYADSEFEQGAAGWTVTSGPATIARSSPWGAHFFSVEYSLAVTSATAGTSVLTSARFPLGPDADTKAWSMTFAAMRTSGGWTISGGFNWYDASGTLISTETPLPDTLPSDGAWWLFTDPGNIPAGAVSASLKLTLVATAATSALYMDYVGLLPAVPITEIEVFEDAASIRLTIRQEVPGRLVSLWRVAADGSRTLVRGPSGLYGGVPLVSDTLIVEDYEAPLGVAVSYHAEVWDATTGALKSTANLGPVVIPVTNRLYGWLKDPGNPQRNQRVLLEEPAPDFQAPIDQATYVVQGRTNKVVRSGKRQGLEGTLLISTESDAQRLNLKWLFDSGNTLLFQAAPGFGVEDMYVSVGAISMARPAADATDPWRTWTLPLIAQDMPITVGVAGSAGRTWRDILSEFATWQEVRDKFATWEDLFLNRRKAA